MRSFNQKVVLRLFEILEGEAAAMVDIVWAMSTGLDQSYRRWHALAKSERSPGTELIADWKAYRKEYLTYYRYLSALEEQGMIERQGKRKAFTWTLGKKGKKKLHELQQQQKTQEQLVMPGGVTIVSYDIPERLRKKRDQLRDFLTLLEFEQIHKSLWFANKKAGEGFVDHLREQGILDFVHIFEIAKQGTLQKIRHD